jgi:hypothetical protein
MRELHLNPLGRWLWGDDRNKTPRVMCRVVFLFPSRFRLGGGGVDETRLVFGWLRCRAMMDGPVIKRTMTNLIETAEARRHRGEREGANRAD